MFKTCNMPYIFRMLPDPAVKPKILATTTCGGRSICRWSGRIRNVRALAQHPTSAKTTQDYQM